MSEPVASRPADDLWEWMSALVCADGLLTSRSDRIVAVGWLIARSGDGTSGQRCVVDDRIAAHLGIGRRTLYRTLSRLLDEGWLVQTAKPTGGARGQRGRRARYRLTIPESSATSERDDDTRPEQETRASGERDDGTRPDEESRATVALPAGTRPDDGDDGVVCQIAPSRVPSQGKSCATAERERGTVTTSDGPTSDGPTSVGDSGRQAQTVPARSLAESAPREDQDRHDETDPPADGDGGWSLVDATAHADAARAAIRGGRRRDLPVNGGR